MTEASNSFDLTNMKIDAVNNAIFREAEINYQEAELKVMQEGGDIDDLSYLCEGVASDVFTKVKKVIKAIIENIKKFFSQLKTRVIAIFTKKETTEQLDKLEKKTKIFPLFNKKKVVIDNTDAQIKCCDEHLDKIKKLNAKAKAGQEVTVDDVDEVKQSFLEKHGKLVGVAAAVTIALGAAIALIKKRSKNISTDIVAVEKDANTFESDVLKNVEKYNDPSVATAITRVESELSKAKANDIIQGSTQTLSSIKRGIASFGKTKVDTDTPIGESTDNPETVMDPKEMEKIASSVKNMKEDGDDYSVDDEPDTDPWDDVMGEFTSLESSENNHVSGKPSNESIVASLFKSIMHDAKEKDTTSEHDPLVESTFDKLMSDIEDLY